jgi:hypothetical protein
MSNGIVDPSQRRAQTYTRHGSREQYVPNTSARMPLQPSQIQIPQIPAAAHRVIQLQGPDTTSISASLHGQVPSGSIPRMAPGGNQAFQARVPVDQPPSNRQVDANFGAAGSSSSGPSLGSASNNIPNAASALLGNQGNQAPTLARSIINALGKRKAADMSQSPVPSKRQAAEPTNQFTRATQELQPPEPSIPNVPPAHAPTPSEFVTTEAMPGIDTRSTSTHAYASATLFPAPEQTIAEAIEEIVPPRDPPIPAFVSRIIPNPPVVTPIVTEPETPSPRQSEFSMIWRVLYRY